MVFQGWFEHLETVEKIIRQWLDMLSLFLCEIRWKISWYAWCPHLHITSWFLSLWTSWVFLAFACLLLLTWCDTLWYHVCYVAVGWQGKVHGQVMESWMLDMQAWHDIVILDQYGVWLMVGWFELCHLETRHTCLKGMSLQWVPKRWPVPIPVIHMGFKTPADHYLLYRRLDSENFFGGNGNLDYCSAL